MKIIFDNYEQKMKFIEEICPSFVNLPKPDECENCKSCWEQAAELIVKGEDNENRI